MSFENGSGSFKDMLGCMDLIAGFLRGFDLAAYGADRKTRLAVERLLQHLTEAAYRLGPNAEILCRTIDWRGIRGLGNVLRHEYDEIDDTVIWQAIQTRLPPLKVSVEEASSKLQSRGPKEPQ